MERGLGCASVVPAGWIGLAGLADYAGPQGWPGLAEFIGWIVLCVAAGLTVAGLLGRWREGGARRAVSASIALVLVAAFTYLPLRLGLDAPMVAKTLFTTALQIAGSVAVAAAVLWIPWTFWRGRRRS